MSQLQQTTLHLSNSGVERRHIFSSQADFDRFEAYLYLFNAVESPRVANLFVNNRMGEIFETGRGERLISIAAYSFTPQAFHILAKPLIEGGIGKFMQKLQTGYTMYFNKKYARTGRLFESSYKSRALTSDDELKHYFTYVHLHPAVMFDSHWEEQKGSDFEKLAVHAMNYRYSSINEYLTSKFVITSPEDFPRSITRARNMRRHIEMWRKRRKTK